MTADTTVGDSGLRTVHTLGEEITAEYRGVALLRYRYRPDPDPFEGPKPYLHPLRTLAGDVVTGYRPNDHRWHKGVQMTASHLSGQNFWGGNSYVTGQGYQALPERVGTQRHDGFAAVEAEPDRLRIVERLTWASFHGETYAEERREITVHSLDPEDGSWALDFATALTNRRGRPLHFGSPTTHGRPQAGYTGFFWRGPRCFHGGQVIGPEGPVDEREMMGRQAPWVGYRGVHDEVDRTSTVVVAHAPGNDDGRPSHWFVRSTETPMLNPSLAFHREFELADGDTLVRRYRLVVADGGWDADRIAHYLGTHPWDRA